MVPVQSDGRKLIIPEITNGRPPRLEEAFTYLQQQKFDPNFARYEFPIETDSPILCHDLLLWSKILEYESTLVAVKLSDGLLRSRLSTGTLEETSTHFLREFMTRSGYLKSKDKFYYRFHNHSEVKGVASDPYPSVSDLASAGWDDFDFIVSAEGVTWYGIPPLTENPSIMYPALPGFLKEKFGKVPLGLVLNDIQIWAGLMDYLQEISQEFKEAPNGRKSRAVKKLFCQTLGVVTFIMNWNQEELINKIMAQLYKGSLPKIDKYHTL